jgi:hypothetical protein
VLITLTARIFSGSHTKESHARMRNKTDNPLPETTQAPPASPAPASPAPPTFHPHEWSTLQDEVLRVIALVGGKRELGLAIVNRDLRSGLLEGTLVAPDGTPTPLSRTDWERRTVHAPHNPAEGVRVEPYEAGYYFVRRAGLAGSTSPATPAATADGQLYAAGGSEPSQSPQAEREAAAAPTSDAEIRPEDQLPPTQSADPAPAPKSEDPPALSDIAADDDGSAGEESVTRVQWLNNYLTEKRQEDLLARYDTKTSAAGAIHKNMLKDKTVDAYARARNIERHPIMQSLYPDGSSPKKKKG